MSRERASGGLSDLRIKTADNAEQAAFGVQQAQLAKSKADEMDSIPDLTLIFNNGLI